MEMPAQSRWFVVLLAALCVSCGSSDAGQESSESAAGTPPPESATQDGPAPPPEASAPVELADDRIALVEPPLSLPAEACIPLGEAPDLAPIPVETPEGTPPQLVGHIVALERELAEAAPEEMPMLLYRLGVIKSGLGIWFGSSILAFGRMRSDFGIDEISGEFRYSGVDYRRLIELFPDSDLADDAGYRIAHAPHFGECEGWIACYVGRDWYKVAPFLRSFPESDFASGEVRRAIESFRQIPVDTDLRVGAEYRSPEGFRTLVSSLDSVGSEVPPAVGGPLLERAAEIWTQFADYERARSSLSSLLGRQGDPSVAQCLAERARSLPTDWVRQDLVEVSDSLGATLTWAAIEEAADSVLVYRSSSAAEIGEVVGRPAPGATTWSDESFSGDAVNWYRIVAYTPTGAVGSNPSSAGGGQ